MRRLIDTRAKVPPGEWRFVQPYGNGKRKGFGPTPEYSDLVRQVSNFRKANKMDRSSMYDASLDVESFMVAMPHIGGDNRFTYKADPGGQAVGVPSPPAGCASCGAKV